LEGFVTLASLPRNEGSRFVEFGGKQIAKMHARQIE
jgi:hypothetical protein